MQIQAGKLFPIAPGLSKHFTLAAPQQPKERVKIKGDLSLDTVPHTFPVGALSKETITLSHPPQTQLHPQMLHNLQCCKERGYLAPTALQADGGSELQQEGWWQQGKPPQDKQVWLCGHVELLQLLRKKQNQSCRKHLLAQPWLPRRNHPSDY